MKTIYDEALLKKLYVDDRLSVEDVSAQTGYSLRGLRSKLGSMGVYRKKTYLTKQGNIPVKKRVLIDKLIPLLDITPTEGDTLEKLSKRILQQILIKTEKTLVDQQAD